MVDEVMQRAQEAFDAYKNIPAADRSLFLENIAGAIEQIREEAVATAQEETHLPAVRLNGELTRTTTQLKMFAALLREGSWVEASIDTREAALPAKADIRKMLVPVGPVIVFGASNFPFAFSTAGGDTASALAAGCTVVVKGHSAHARTSALIFQAIEKAIGLAGMPPYTVQHVMGSGNTVGAALVKHPYAKGVGFTGSFSGGKALVEYAQQREQPIPVFAEMSSINPVVFYPDTVAKNAASLAAVFAGSITLGVGQFCTNPGVLFGIRSEAFDKFLDLLGEEISKVQPQQMLHSGICVSYRKGVATMLGQKGLEVKGRAMAGMLTGGGETGGRMLKGTRGGGEGGADAGARETEMGTLEAEAVLAVVSGAAFLQNPHLKEEVFGPYSLAVVCADRQELLRALQSLKGQLTSTIVGTAEDVAEYADVIAVQRELAGRIILNQPPTGVEVNASMVHGGPYPATTDARFTSVGATAIKRWVRPLCLQNFMETMLPDALKNSNPSGILRLVNNQYTREAIHE